MKRNRAARIKEIAEEIKQGRSELRKLKSRERKEKKLFNELEAQTKSAAVLVAEKREDVEKEEAAEKENIENQNAEILSKKQELKELARKKDDLAMRDQDLRQEVDRVKKNHE